MGFFCSLRDLWHKVLQLWTTNGRPSLSRILKPVTCTVQNSKGSPSQISSKQIITIADEAEITASTNVFLILYNYVEAKTVLYAMFVLESDRTQSLHIHRARLRIGNLGTKLLFINIRWNCARSVNGQWNAELKRIFPEVFVFPFRWTRVTRALGTRLCWSMIDSKWSHFIGCYA